MEKSKVKPNVEPKSNMIFYSMVSASASINNFVGDAVNYQQRGRCPPPTKLTRKITSQIGQQTDQRGNTGNKVTNYLIVHKQK